jgi:HSP20 family molecular chaperone IbpA
MDDWLNAERELFQIPESELVERNDKIEARVSAPGFEPSDVQVIAMSDALIAKAQSTHQHDGSDGDVSFCEFDRKTLFRRLDLPKPINVDQVSANPDKGVLQLTALKLRPGDQSGRHSIAA